MADCACSDFCNSNDDNCLCSEWWDADEREYCNACGAEVDHYLGCPDDPNPDYEAEADFAAVYGAGCTVTQRQPSADVEALAAQRNEKAST